MKLLFSLLLLPLTTITLAQTGLKQNPLDFIPKGYVFFEKITGDLDKDGTEDCVLIIKATKKDQIITDEIQGKVDRNRRGILILFRKNGYYKPVLENYQCFSSENEDGGAYIPPELEIEITKGNLYVHYGHGRYGYWRYIFAYRNADFVLTGFDQAYRSETISKYERLDEESINFLTGRKLTRKVIKTDKNGNDIFSENWKNIRTKKLIRLSEVKDFDKIDMNEIVEEKK